MLDRWLCWGWKPHKWGKVSVTVMGKVHEGRICSVCGYTSLKILMEWNHGGSFTNHSRL